MWPALRRENNGRRRSMQGVRRGLCVSAITRRSAGPWPVPSAIDARTRSNQIVFINLGMLRRLRLFGLIITICDRMAEGRGNRIEAAISTNFNRSTAVSLPASHVVCWEKKFSPSHSPPIVGPYK